MLVAGLGLGFAASFAYSEFRSAQFVRSNVLYGALWEVIERNRPGTQNNFLVDVTADVCPVFDAGVLEEAWTEIPNKIVPRVSRTGTKLTWRFVRHEWFEWTRVLEISQDTSSDDCAAAVVNSSLI